MAKSDKTKPNKAPARTKAPRNLRKENSDGFPVCIALFPCEQVIVEKNGLVSAMRIIDTITMPPEGVQTAKIGQHMVIGTLQLLLMVKKGDSKGHFTMQIDSVSPDQERTTIAYGDTKWPHDSPEAGTNMNFPFRLVWRGPGMYWTELVIDGHLIARCPLNLVVSENSTVMGIEVANE